MTQTPTEGSEWFSVNLQDVKTVHKALLGTVKTWPNALYHYTSPEGLNGILACNSIWASHYAHLNDEGESTYRETLIDEALSVFHEKAEELDSYAFELLLHWVNARKFGGIPDDDYVVSFSEKHDHLSQWERYGGSHGYALGFEIEPTTRRLIDAGYLVGPIVYQREDQLEILALAIEFAMLRHSEREADDDVAALYTWAANYSNHFQLICRSFKHWSFEEEAEWRATKTLRLNDVADVHFRTGQFGLVPYIKFEAILDAPALIHEITVARTHYFEGAKRALILRLLSAGIDPELVQIVHSEVPLRT